MKVLRRNFLEKCVFPIFTVVYAGSVLPVVMKRFLALKNSLNLLILFFSSLLFLSLVAWTIKFLFNCMKYDNEKFVVYEAFSKYEVQYDDVEYLKTTVKSRKILFFSFKESKWSILVKGNSNFKNISIPAHPDSNAFKEFWSTLVQRNQNAKLL